MNVIRIICFCSLICFQAYSIGLPIGAMGAGGVCGWEAEPSIRLWDAHPSVSSRPIGKPHPQKGSPCLGPNNKEMDE